MAPEPDIRVNFDRLKADIESLAQIGRDPRGGLSRPSFSPADREARDWLKDKIEEAGLAYRRDGAGNIFGRLGEGSPVVLSGSHIDTVINGGKFDGAAGVLAALECVRRLSEEGWRPARPLEIVSFTDEEGGLVGDFLGSRAFAGRLNRSEVESGLTSFGRPLADLLAGTGITIESILRAHEERPEVAAYLELHIEQGSVLETEGAAIGIVKRLAGKNYRWCSYLGRADHGGTTPLELRRDAFLATADFALRGTQFVARHHYGGVMTIGKVAVHPGSFSVVPGHVDFSLDMRSDSGETLRTMEKEILALAEEVAAARGLSFRSRLVDETEPVSLSARLVEMLKEEATGLGYAPLMMASGAGHDAQIVSSIADSGMIFIPCADGISHAPEEAINWDDLEKGANLLLRALIRLAS